MSVQVRPEGRRPFARHGRFGMLHPITRLLAVLGVVLAVVGLSAGGVGAFALWNAAQAVADSSVAIGDEESIPPSLGAIEGGVNLLLVGSDSCEGQDVALFPRCANEDAEGERNDVTMLVHISDAPRRVTVVSFPRDMIVPIPACPREDGNGDHSAMSAQMINASYMYGGLPCTVKTVEELTGESIHFAASIRWTGVINMSDAIGGVEVCVAGDISDGHTGLNLAAGPHTLQGVEALQFLRIRHGIGDGSDLGRISNQQQFMSSMVRTLQGDGVLGNPGTLFSLATTAISQVNEGQLVLSQSLANPTLMAQIAMAVKDVPYEDIVFVQYPTEYGDNFSRVLPVRDAADQLFAALRENKALNLTGDASQGDGVEVTGEAAKPEGDAEPVESAAPSPETPAVPEDRVDLPSSIAGQTAAQVTCTLPER
ncbi:LCP family protein [Microbacterium sp. NPDC055910]|uniref:LCP family protein n=1 Tax=Microbacterium sp. NPDC055910 TaxID=3345659 RepID=UPI0035E0EB5C